jgi:inner membrane protein COX18
LLDTIAPWTLVPLHDALQAVHLGTGLPWYVLIPLATVAMRTAVTLPVAIANRVRTRKQVALAPVLAAAGPVLRARLAASEAARQGRLTTEQVTVLAQKEARRRRVDLFRRHGCQVWKSVVLLPLVQMPVWVGTSLVVRAMCGWAAGGVTAIGVEPGFSAPAEAAFAWYPDLVTADPYGVLPLIIGAVSLANVEWNTNNLLNRSGSASRQSLQSQGGPVQRVVANLSRVGVLFFMTAAFQAPAALCLYWASSASFSFVQNVAFDRFLPLHRVDPRSVTATTGSAVPTPNRIETRVIRA